MLITAAAAGAALAASFIAAAAAATQNVTALFNDTRVSGGDADGTGLLTTAHVRRVRRSFVVDEFQR